MCGLLIDRRERTITAALSPFRTIFFWSKRERGCLRIRDDDGTFIEFSLPLQFLQKKLALCASQALFIIASEYLKKDCRRKEKFVQERQSAPFQEVVVSACDS